MVWIALAAGVVLGAGGFIGFCYFYFRWEDRRLIRLKGHGWVAEEEMRPSEQVGAYLAIAGCKAFFDSESHQYVVTRPGMHINDGITLMVRQDAPLADWKKAAELALRYHL